MSRGRKVIITELLIIFALVLVNGVLSGSEIAVVSLRKTRLQALVDEGRGAARAVKRLRDAPERFLATVQIGITVVSATAGAFGGSTFAGQLEPFLSRVPGLGRYAHQLALIAVITLVSYLSLVLGELVPKSLALRATEGYALVIGRPLLWLSSATRPLVWFLTVSSNAVLRLFGDRTNFMEARISPDELQQLVEEASENGGTIHPAAGKIASRAIELETLTAADVMVPRGNVVGLSTDATLAQVRTVLMDNKYTRFPIYEGAIDNIVGYVTVKDLLFRAWDGGAFSLSDMLHPPYFVPETKRAVDLLEEMRERRLPLATVVDERGGMAGITTLEDLFEELIGDVVGEYQTRPTETVRRDSDGSALVSGSVPVRDVNREMHTQLPEDGDWTTVAGLALALSGRIPTNGDSVVASDGTVLEVVDASARR
ncbi:MAG TPA: hemolysin family protein, partial [Myxococcaceae bacterium]|nr:hemolysin family protein [Myxococcaceae bacterium]